MKEKYFDWTMMEDIKADYQCFAEKLHKCTKTPNLTAMLVSRVSEAMKELLEESHGKE